MAEYKKFSCPQGDDFEGGDECDRCDKYEICMETPTADVIERSEFEEMVKSFKAMVEIKNENLIAMRDKYYKLEKEYAELKFNIDKAIEEMEKTENTQEHIFYDGDICARGAFNDGIEKALEILKRNIGE
jgi:hypothetical protein